MSARRKPRAALSLVLLASITSVAWTHRAAADSRESAAARLFEEARALQLKGHQDDACARFEASEKLEPAVGTLLNLAECAARKGATATASQRYRQAAAMAARRADAEREALATREGDALEQRLSRMVLRLPAKGLPASATVWRDAEVVPQSELGAAVAVDPGAHRVIVKAPSFKPWSTWINIGTGPSLVSVELPALEPEESEARTVPDVPARRGLEARPPEQTARAPSPSRATVQTWPLVVGGGVGVAALAVGGYFALRARSIWSDVDARCPGGRCPDPRTVSALSSQQAEAKTDATLGTVMLLVGGAVIGAGIIVSLLLPRAQLTAARANAQGVVFGFQ